MFTYEELLGKVNERLLSLDISSEPHGLYEPIRYALSLGGKRLRPVLCLMGCNLFSDEIEDTMHAALGLEVFHNFTLLHDDIMDNADIRRGKPTVHKMWNKNTAILSGDAMHNLSLQQMLKVPRMFSSIVLIIFSKMVSDVCEGQQYDMEFETMDEVSMDQYISMIRQKTSSLIASSLMIGGLMGGADQKQVELIATYGENLGQAFQLKDDYLDVWGDSKTFGKPIGGDILCNKKTYPLIRAFEMASPKQREELKDLLNKKDQTDREKIEKVTSLFTQIGVKEECLRIIEDYTNRALSALSIMEGVEKGRKEELIKVAQKMLIRTK